MSGTLAWPLSSDFCQLKCCQNKNRQGWANGRYISWQLEFEAAQLCPFNLNQHSMSAAAAAAQQRKSQKHCIVWHWKNTLSISLFFKYTLENTAHFYVPFPNSTKKGLVFDPFTTLHFLPHFLFPLVYKLQGCLSPAPLGTLYVYPPSPL